MQSHLQILVVGSPFVNTGLLKFEVSQDVRVCPPEKLKDPVKMKNLWYVSITGPPKTFHGAKVLILIS
jgi:hypothetical protein